MVSFGTSKSTSQSFQQSFVDPQQQSFLSNLRTNAQQLTAQQQGPGGVDQLFGLSQGLLGAGAGALGQLGGIQEQLSNIPGAQDFAAQGAEGFGAGLGALGQQVAGDTPALQSLLQQAQGQNPFLQQNINQLGQDITQQFGRQLVGINQGAVGAGQLGGGRQGVAEGLLGEAALGEFGRGATQLRSEDIGRQLSAAGTLAGLQGTAAGQQAQLGQAGFLGAEGLQQAGLGAAGELGLGGLSQLQGLFNLGLSPFQAQFGPLESLAGIIGQPTVLSQGQSFGRGKGTDFGVFTFSGSNASAES